MNKFKELLIQTNYPKGKRDKLIKGFREGFEIGCEGPEDRSDFSDNILITIGSKTKLWNKVMKEVKENRYAGPFNESPYKNFMQSPIRLVPKAGNKTRLIFNLSYNFKTNHSLNHFTPRDKCTVQYRDLDYAIHTCLKLMEDEDWHQGTIFMGKSDLSLAFRLVPIKKNHWKWLTMKAENPVTKMIQYFVDKCIPFGPSISCSHFQCFSDALCHLFEVIMKKPFRVTNYLDDFLFIAKSEDECNEMVRGFLTICKDINCPVSMEKTEWATPRIVFLGILLDGRNKVLCILEDKRIKALKMTKEFSEQKKSTIKNLQRLTGTLNFLTRAIVPGRAFTRRLYAKTTHTYLTKEGKPLRAHHHVNLDVEFRNDCAAWTTFLEAGNKAGLCRPFVDVEKFAYANAIEFFTDSSRGEDKGFGCIFGRRWAFGQWEHGFIKNYEPSIEYLELYALCMGVFIWGKHLKNTVGVSRGYTDHYQGRGHSIRLTAALINIHEHLI